MAAAVLGHAARRLGGGALQTSLSSAMEGRLIMPRFAHTGVQYPCNCGKFVKEKAADLSRLQRMKEELFEATKEWYKKYGNDQDSASRTNRALLRELSDQVCRRSSGDPTWEWARKSQLRHDILKATGFVTLVSLGNDLCSKALALAVGDETSEASFSKKRSEDISNSQLSAGKNG